LRFPGTSTAQINSPVGVVYVLSLEVVFLPRLMVKSVDLFHLNYSPTSESPPKPRQPLSSGLCPDMSGSVVHVSVCVCKCEGIRQDKKQEGKIVVHGLVRVLLRYSLIGYWRNHGKLSI